MVSIVIIISSWLVYFSLKNEKKRKTLEMAEILITDDDLNIMQKKCLEDLKKEEIYYLRNDAKLKAVTTTSSYEEFKQVNIIILSHL